MLSKDKLVEMATAAGYKVAVENRIPMFQIKEKELPKLKKYLKEVGYSSTFGARYSIT